MGEPVRWVVAYRKGGADEVCPHETEWGARDCADKLLRWQAQTGAVDVRLCRVVAGPGVEEKCGARANGGGVCTLPVGHIDLHGDGHYAWFSEAPATDSQSAPATVDAAATGRPPLGHTEESLPAVNRDATTRTSAAAPAAIPDEGITMRVTGEQFEILRTRDARLRELAGLVAELAQLELWQGAPGAKDIRDRARKLAGGE